MRTPRAVKRALTTWVDGAGLCRFKFVAGDSNRKGSLNSFHRNDQTAVAIRSCKIALDAVETSSPNAHFLTKGQIRIRDNSGSLIEHLAYRLNLFIGNRNANAPRAHETADRVDRVTLRLRPRDRCPRAQGD